MNVLLNICKFIEKHMAIIILIIALISLFIPKTSIWIEINWINYLLMFVMFGMGLVLKLDDLALVLKNPKEILIGTLAQFTIMPLLAFTLGKLFALDAGLFAGIILVGACPGGTASNIITYLSKGDLALSVSITTVNTLLAPVLTPFIVYFLLHTVVDINIFDLFIAIINIVIVPIVLGILVNKFLGKYIEKFKGLLPALSILAISMIVATVVSHNASKIISTGLIIFIVVILHNLLGYLLGYLVAKLSKMNEPKAKAMAIEVGMQNAGLATSLAATSFPSLALATLPGAVFSIWHNISGALIAGFFSKRL